VASQVIMDDGTESTMTKHRRAERASGTIGLDDEYRPGPRCLGRHHPARQDPGHQARRTAPAERGRPGRRAGTVQPTSSQ